MCLRAPTSARDAVLPDGTGGAAIGIATVPLPDLLAALRRELTPDHTSDEEQHMPDRAPQKPSEKKAGKSLKEKRDAKRDKKDKRALH